jgi:hypothetical protein
VAQCEGKPACRKYNTHVAASFCTCVRKEAALGDGGQRVHYVKKKVQ